MDLLLEGILIAIMMVIILFFIVYEYSAFFAPKSSISYYNSFVGMADSACTSIQTASNVQFSSPTIFVFQMYDGPSCNSILGSNSYIFSPNSAVLSSLNGNYNLCYANVSNPTALGISSGNQYFLESSSKNNVNFYFAKSNAIPNSSNMSINAVKNQISTSGVEANSSTTFSLILTAEKSVSPQNYSFHLDQYSNSSVNIAVYFNGETTCSLSYSNKIHYYSISLTPPCLQNINNVTIQVTPVSNTAVNYQVNFTAVPDSNPSQQYLSQQCTNLVPMVNEGIINNGSIVCEPVICGGNSFLLSDQNNRPFLGLYGGSYTFLGVQSGVNDLQIVNSYSEQLINASLMDETVFEEGGLPAGSTWGVTYDGVTKTSSISLSGGGNTIAFSNPYGNYSFSIPSTSAIIGKTVRTFKPTPSNGKVPQGSFVSVGFKVVI